jgi:hypothetical protein
MPARIIEAKPWKSFSIREQRGRNGFAAAVQKQTRWLDVYIATLANKSWGIGTSLNLSLFVGG